MSFEEKMEKINALLKSLNDKDLSLEESVKLYKQGVGRTFYLERHAERQRRRYGRLRILLDRA